MADAHAVPDEDAEADADAALVLAEVERFARREIEPRVEQIGRAHV